MHFDCTKTHLSALESTRVNWEWWKWKVLTQVYKLQVKVLVIFHQAAKIIYKYLFFDNIWVMQVLNLEYEKEELFFPGGVFDLFPI